MEFKNKYIFYIIIALIIFILFYLNYPKEETGLIILSDGEILPNNICNLINNQIIVIDRTGCSACAVAVPRLKELENELNINIKYYDMAIEEERNELLSMNFTTNYVPALVVNCKAYIGVRSKEEFKDIIQNG